MLIYRRKLYAVISVILSTVLFISTLQLKAFAETGDIVTGGSTEALENLTFTEDTSDFVNPERGWLRIYKSSDIWGFNTLKAQNINLVMVEVDLKDFLSGPISNQKLSEINNAFSQARTNGLKVIFRAAYDFDGVAKPEPKELSIITGHIAQLKQVFYDNEDVLYCVQAGFLGPWGEWHSSYFGDSDGTPTLEARKAVLFALMDAVPVSRMIQVRRPMFIRDIFSQESGGNILTDTTAFSGSYLSRTGYHDDALLSSKDECGTYVDEAYSREDELNWAQNQDQYTPFGGEANTLSSFSDSTNAIYELGKLHTQFINIDYLDSVINKWKNTSINGESTFLNISKRMGYRFVITDGKISSKATQGNQLHLILNIRNDGFGNVINQRNAQIVISNGIATYSFAANSDVRRWLSGSTQTIDLTLSLPKDIAPGQWNVYLNLPDSAPTISNNPAYSIRLANQGVWQATTGYNLIKKDLVIHQQGIIVPTTVSVSAISLSDSSATINVGNTRQLTATIAPTDATNKGISFASSNTAVATVNSSGLVTAVAAGNAVITATTDDGRKTANCTINVTIPVISVFSADLNENAITINIGSSRQLTTTILPSNATNKNISYTSSNTTVATVDSNGLVKAIAAGTAVITVTSADGNKTANCNVTVPAPPPVQDTSQIAFSVNGNASEWSSIPVLAQKSTGNINILKTSYSKNNLYLLITGKSLNVKSQFYIDVDNNATTGYKVGEVGSEFLIENNVLYKYSGTNGGWKWTKVASISISKNGSVIEVAIPITSINIARGSTISVYFLCNDNRAESLTGKYSL